MLVSEILKRADDLKTTAELSAKLEEKVNKLVQENYTEPQIEFIIDFECGIAAVWGMVVYEAAKDGGVAGLLAGMRIGAMTGNPIDVAVGGIVFAGAGAAGTYLYMSAASETIMEIAEQGAKDLLQVSDRLNRDYKIDISLSIDGDNTNDTLTGTDTSLIGLGGNDTINGNEGNDNISGKGGNDSLTGGTGSDIIYGGKGKDTLAACTEDVAGANTDVDYLFGEDDNDKLIGGNGTSYLDGGSGADTLMGFNGNDTYVFDDNSDYFYDKVIEYGNEGSIDTLDFSKVTNNLINVNLSLTNGGIFTAGSNVTGIEILKGGSGSDSLTGTALNDTIYGNGGNDTLIGGKGSDVLIGGSGSDTYVFDDNDVTTNALTGEVNGKPYTTYYTDVADKVIESAGDVNGTSDILDFSKVTKNIFINLSSIDFPDGSDISGVEILKSGSGADSLTGTSHNDTIYGNAGNDTVDGGSGSDVMYGGKNNDTYIVDNAGDKITENAGEGTDTVKSSVTYTLGANLENLYLTGKGNINGTGNSLNNYIYGNSGNNTLKGLDGNDTLVASAGKNDLQGGAGNDTYKISKTGTYSITDTDKTGRVVLDGATLTGGLRNVDYGNLSKKLYSDGTNTYELIGSDLKINNNITVKNYSNGDLGINLGTEADLAAFADATKENGIVLTADSGLDFTPGSTITINYEGGGVNYNTVVGNHMTGPEGDSEYIVTSKYGTSILGKLFAIFNVGDPFIVAYGAEIVVPEGATQLRLVLNDMAGQYFDNAGGFNLEIISKGADYKDVLGTNNNDKLTGTDDKDIITGDVGDDYILSKGGNDIIAGGTGIDTMIGGAGNDTYYVDNTGDKITENSKEGTDAVNSSVTYTLGSNIESLTLTGTATINGTGNTLNNTITGNSANNVINGSTGADTMIGGVGNDTYYVDNTKDVITENANQGTDIVNSSITYTLGNNLENLILAGTAAINGTGNTLNNTITGNSANNVINGSTGADTMIGGAGNDTYYVDNTKDVITENANQGTDTVNSNITCTLGNNLENLILTETAAINGTGNTLNNAITGNSAVNTLTGGAGNDTLNGGAGADKMIGGAGNDTYYVDNAKDVITENASQGTDTVNSSITYTLGNNLENLTLTGTTAINGTGNTLNNTITGNSANNTLTGGAGNDTYIFGLGSKSDTIVDTAGTDKVHFNSDVAKSNIAMFVDSSKNLIIDYGTTKATDVIKIQNQASYTIEKIELSSGQYLTSTDINKLIQNMTAFAKSKGISMTSATSVRNNQNLMNLVAAAWHN